MMRKRKYEKNAIREFAMFHPLRRRVIKKRKEDAVSTRNTVPHPNSSDLSKTSDGLGTTT